MSVVPNAELREYNVAMPVYDVRDYKLAAEGN